MENWAVAGKGGVATGVVPQRCCRLWTGEGTAVGWLGRAKGCFGVQLQGAVMVNHVPMQQHGFGLPLGQRRPPPDTLSHVTASPVVPILLLGQSTPPSVPSCSGTQPPSPTHLCPYAGAVVLH